jgi:hypothetical protein
VWVETWSKKNENEFLEVVCYVQAIQQDNMVISNWDNLEGGNNGFQNKFKPIKLFETCNKYSWPRVKWHFRWDYFFQNIHNCVYINARYLT